MWYGWRFKEETEEESEWMLIFAGGGEVVLVPTGPSATGGLMKLVPHRHQIPTSRSVITRRAITGFLITAH